MLIQVLLDTKLRGDTNFVLGSRSVSFINSIARLQSPLSLDACIIIRKFWECELNVWFIPAGLGLKYMRVWVVGEGPAVDKSITSSWVNRALCKVRMVDLGKKGSR